MLSEEGELGLIPEQVPSLTWTGEKLQPVWVEQLIGGKLNYRPRPWLKARMPAFPRYAAQIAHGFAAQHAVDSESSRDPVAIKPETQRLAEALLEKSGLDCRQCHAPASEILDLKNEAQGIGLAYMSQRLRREYYDRWMPNPLRIDPSTKMPQFSSDGMTTAARHLAGGDAKQQFEAIWEYLNLLGKQ
jgi:hypothetical protein